MLQVPAWLGSAMCCWLVITQCGEGSRFLRCTGICAGFCKSVLLQPKRLKRLIFEQRGCWTLWGRKLRCLSHT